MMEKKAWFGKLGCICRTTAGRKRSRGKEKKNEGIDSSRPSYGCLEVFGQVSTEVTVRELFCRSNLARKTKTGKNPGFKTNVLRIANESPRSQVHKNDRLARKYKIFRAPFRWRRSFKPPKDSFLKPERQQYLWELKNKRKHKTDLASVDMLPQVMRTTEKSFAKKVILFIYGWFLNESLLHLSVGTSCRHRIDKRGTYSGLFF